MKSVTEWNLAFDLLWNNIASNRAPGLMLYEKSVFLTMAQKDMVICLYDGKNPTGESFESIEEMRSCLAELVTEYVPTEVVQGGDGVSSKSVFYVMPDNMIGIVYEQVTMDDASLGCENGKVADVVPVTHDEYHRIRRNPFRGPGKGRVLRLDVGKDSEKRMVELVSKYSFKDYKARYVRMPDPIILESLEGTGLTIDNQTDEMTCKLNPILHDSILRRAVQLAAESWRLGTMNNN